MNKIEVLKYYSRKEIQNVMLKTAKDREVVGSFEDGSYYHRPDTMMYPNDILERVNKGICTFHCSVEKWSQPMRLSSGLGFKELEDNRIGFDYILDIDSKSKIEHAMIGAKIVCEFLKDNGVNATVKFSGRRGFHIGIAQNAFPEKIDFKPIRIMYPEIPQSLAFFIREKVKERLLEELISYEGGVAALTKTVPSVSELSPYSFIEFEKDWGNRHLFRMPFSLHVKTWLVSLPLDPKKIMSFKLEDAKPDKVKPEESFLVNKDGEATDVLIQALDWKSKFVKKEKKSEERIIKKPGAPIPEEYFPPCIKLILNGIKDGKKRSLFTLIAFLRSVNWKDEDVEQAVIKWNQKNDSPLRDQLLKTQLKWHFRQPKALMPANCESDLFYKSIGVCKPEWGCSKNPVNYAFKKFSVRRVNKKQI